MATFTATEVTLVEQRGNEVGILHFLELSTSYNNLTVYARFILYIPATVCMCQHVLIMMRAVACEWFL